MINEIITSLVLVTGAAFMFISALGIIRFPDLYTRMHAATKASSFGIMLILTALCIYFFSWALLLKSVLIVIFIFATIPVASHLIAGTAHFLKVKKWIKTVMDEWEDSQA